MLAGVHAIVIADEALADRLRKTQQKGLLPPPGVGSIAIRAVQTGHALPTQLPLFEFMLAGTKRFPGKLRIE